MKKKAIVVGAGIVGLSVARVLADKGYAVTVVEKSGKAIGASVRNFGMVWPIGQPSGELYQLARKSAEIWKLVCDGTGMWYNQSGSLHVANNDIEWTVLNELYDIFNKEGRPVQLFSKDKIAKHYPYVNQQSLLGGLYSFFCKFFNTFSASFSHTSRSNAYIVPSSNTSTIWLSLAIIKSTSLYYLVFIVIA